MGVFVLFFLLDVMVIKTKHDKFGKRRRHDTEQICQSGCRMQCCPVQKKEKENLKKEAVTDEQRDHCVLFINKQ